MGRKSPNACGDETLEIGSTSQCERFNQITWKTVSLMVKGRHLFPMQWEKVLPEVLHSVRTLLCTTTNSTPHERFFLLP